jgi:protein-L-isoaspartate(D-aspartate) O-methyltransferase
MQLGFFLPLLLLALIAAQSAAEEVDEAARARTAMVEIIRLETALSAPLTGVAEIDPRVMAAMAKVPRHEFVPEPIRRYAYADSPLPLGHGQSLTQPYIVALMLHAVRVRADDVVFETGTDTGYVAAVLAELARRVYSVEVVGPLASEAKRILARLGTRNVEVSEADGFYGWAAHAPYDVIVLKEAVTEVPAPLMAQLKPGGRLIAPIGPLDTGQILTLIEKGADGKLSEQKLLPVRFAPLQGGQRI